MPRWAQARAFNTIDSTFLPIDGLNRTDGDVTLVLLFNFARYAEPVEDLWYNADDDVEYASGAIRYKSSKILSVVSLLKFPVFLHGSNSGLSQILSTLKILAWQ